MVVETRASICRFCHAGCAVLADVEDGRLVRVRGDLDDPVYRGFTCEKGRQLPAQHTAPDRLLHSMKRQPDGSHAPISSEQAMDEIAVRLGAILDAHGPRSVASYSGTFSAKNPGNRTILKAWHTAIGSPMVFDSNTIDQPGKSVAQALHGQWQAPPHGILDADVHLLLGANPLVTMGSGIPNPAAYLQRARRRGMRLLVVDPRRTETAAMAEIHLQPRPGEDVAILAGIVRVMLTEGRHDVEFVARHVVGVADLAAAVEPFTPDVVARRADVAVDDFLALARAFGDARRGTALSLTGPSMSGRGSTLVEYLVLCLNTLGGRYLREGDRVWNPGVLLPEVAHRAQARAPWPAYGYGEQLRFRGLADAACGLSTAALADEILTPGEGQVRALFCSGGNPVAAWPDQEKTWRAMRDLDLLVTIDVTMSATAEAADYVIAPKLPIEVPGTTMTQESLYYYAPGMGFPEPYAHHVGALVDPPEGSDVIDDWALFFGLAQRMGQQLVVRPTFVPPGVVDDGWALDMAVLPDVEDLLTYVTRHGRISIDEVRRHPGGGLFPGAPLVVEPPDPTCSDRLDVGNAAMMGELAVASEPWEGEELPFRLVARRALGVLNSVGQTLPKMRRRPYNPAFMHPDDLAELGVAPGDLVEITSPWGRLVGVADADRNLRRGLVSMTHSFGPPPDRVPDVRRTGVSASRLTSTDVDYDRFTGMPRLSNVPVDVRPHAPAASPA